ncbi:MAG: DUF4254 domain-containing protein [Cryomorphaceae bacterium]|nr:MAG: DUF4254 domain-containing protein [Cryomorphaceae bacterium]|tara:strand:- start:1046 stop:1657 length:612 start_codon:yes stop_codon:yes gene_type:complete
MSVSSICNKVFKAAIDDYHISNSVNEKNNNPFKDSSSLEKIIYNKCWIDTVQWHLEDIIRKPNIEPSEALKIKRRIDSSNQDRTDMVEELDEYFFKKYSSENPNQDAILNTETPAWAVDRLSILSLKIYHMKEEAERDSASEDHRKKCSLKLSVLIDQKSNLSTAIDQLFENISNGKVRIATYKQMKMYNDESLNPELYSQND